MRAKGTANVNALTVNDNWHCQTPTTKLSVALAALLGGLYKCLCYAPVRGTNAGANVSAKNAHSYVAAGGWQAKKRNEVNGKRRQSARYHKKKKFINGIITFVVSTTIYSTEMFIHNSVLSVKIIIVIRTFYKPKVIC